MRKRGNRKAKASLEWVAHDGVHTVGGKPISNPTGKTTGYKKGSSEETID